MNKAVEFLEECGTFYLATDDSGHPRNRPFGAVMEYEGKVYFCTNNQKACFRQMLQNPKVEICAEKGGKWIRMTGEMIVDSRREVKEAMLNKHPELKNMYTLDDGIYEVLYLKNPAATLYSFTGEPVALSM